MSARTIDPERISSGLGLIVLGLFKKTVIADHLAAIVDSVYGSGADPTGGEILFATYAFAFQIYCDFAGYSDIARGTARLFGFELMVNFRRPYFARNPADLWHRWHISLSTWLRDYLYISLGGNRQGKGKTLRNLFLTMLLGGLWHGAAWTFVVWGAFHGAWLVIHRVVKPRLDAARRFDTIGTGIRAAVCIAATFHLTCLAWLFFRADSLGRAAALLSGVWTDPTMGSAATWLPWMLVLILPLVAFEIFEEMSDSGKAEPIRSPWLRVPAMAALVLIIIGFGEDHGGTFVYFQF